MRRRYLSRKALGAAIVLTLLVLGGLTPPDARAQSLDALRAEGIVGERFDGYAELRGADQHRATVNDVNAKRKELYEKRAKEQGVPVGQVGRVYAEQIFTKLPAGSWYLPEGGSWQRK